MPQLFPSFIRGGVIMGMFIIRNKNYSQLVEEEREYSKKRKSLEEVDSDKGMKRAFLLSGIDGGGGLVGGYVSKKAAEKADKEGKSDKVILKRAKESGIKAGAATGAITGVAAGLASATLGKKYGIPTSKWNAIKGGFGGATIGALGGRNAASVNTKDRLRKRRGEDY